MPPGKSLFPACPEASPPVGGGKQSSVTAVPPSDEVVEGGETTSCLTPPVLPVFDWTIRLTYSRVVEDRKQAIVIRDAFIALVKLYSKLTFVVVEKAGTNNEHIHMGIVWRNNKPKAFEKAQTAFKKKHGISGNEHIAGSKVDDSDFTVYLCKGNGCGEEPQVLDSAGISECEIKAAHVLYWARNAKRKRKRESMDIIQDRCIKRLRKGAELVQIAEVCAEEVIGRRIWKSAFLGLVAGVQGVVNPTRHKQMWSEIAISELRMR